MNGELPGCAAVGCTPWGRLVEAPSRACSPLNSPGLGRSRQRQMVVFGEQKKGLPGRPRHRGLDSGEQGGECQALKSLSGGSLGLRGSALPSSLKPEPSRLGSMTQGLPCRAEEAGKGEVVCKIMSDRLLKLSLRGCPRTFYPS